MKKAIISKLLTVLRETFDRYSTPRIFSCVFLCVQIVFFDDIPKRQKEIPYSILINLLIFSRVMIDVKSCRISYFFHLFGFC